MKPFSDKALEMHSVGYSLDCGGYEFENFKLGSRCVLAWDDPDPDYIPWITPNHPDGRRQFYGLLGPVYLFSPGEFPETMPSEAVHSGDIIVLRKSGLLEETWRECSLCEGNEGCDDCENCKGYGNVLSAGGTWGLYSGVACENCDGWVQEDWIYPCSCRVPEITQTALDGKFVSYGDLITWFEHSDVEADGDNLALLTRWAAAWVHTLNAEGTNADTVRKAARIYRNLGTDFPEAFPAENRLLNLIAQNREDR